MMGNRMAKKASLVRDLSRRIIVLSAGEKIAEDPPAAVAADTAVVVYLGSETSDLERRR